MWCGVVWCDQLWFEVMRWAVVWCDAMSCGWMWCDVVRRGDMCYACMCFDWTSLYAVVCLFLVLVFLSNLFILKLICCCPTVLYTSYYITDPLNGSGEKQLILLLSSAQILYYCWSAVEQLSAGQQRASSLLLLVSSAQALYYCWSTVDLHTYCCSAVRKEQINHWLTHAGLGPNSLLIFWRLGWLGLATMGNVCCTGHLYTVSEPSSTLSLPYLDNTTLGGKEKWICGFWLNNLLWLTKLLSLNSSRAANAGLLTSNHF